MIRLTALSLSSKLPADDQNGLPAILTELINDPNGLHVAVVVIGVDKIVVTPRTGEKVPRVQVYAIEPMTVTADAAELKRLLRRAAERRTGQIELPLELEKLIDSLDPGNDETDGTGS